MLEAQGIATTSISIIREHSEVVRPPRALWVPFPLGRPLGAADHPEFQTDVLRSALRLLETAEAPTIAEYPHDAPDLVDGSSWACALELPEPDVSDLEAALRAEVDLLRPWYEESRRRRGRTTVGISGARPEQIDAVTSFVLACAEGAGFSEPPAAASGPQWSHPMPILLRHVVEDLRAFYQEAVAARPGQRPPTQHEMHSWIFNDTALGQALIEIGRRIADVGDRPLLMMRGFIIPEGFWMDGPSWGSAARQTDPRERPQDFLEYAAGYLAGETTDAD